MIYLQGINLEIKNRAIIKDLDLFVDKGEFVSIVGANGAGKSTLLKLIAGELKPNSGTFHLNNRPISTWSSKEMAKFRGYLHQANHMDIPFTVEEVVHMGRYQYTTGNQESIVRECIQICELERLKDRSIKELSGGEQQRVHLARILAQIWDMESGILLLDEPISNMDIQYQHLTLAIAKAFTTVGFSVITVLHDLNMVAQYSDRVLMLKAGRKWWYGSPNEVFKQQNIYNIFGVNSEVYINPNNLTTQIQTIPATFKIGDFNSFQRSKKEQRNSLVN